MKIAWTPDKITALVLIVGCLALRFTGIDTEVMSILAMAAAWLFGSSYSDYRKNKGK